MRKERMEGLGSGVGRDRKDGQMAMKMRVHLQLTGVEKKGASPRQNRPGERAAIKNQWGYH